MALLTDKTSYTTKNILEEFTFEEKDLLLRFGDKKSIRFDDDKFYLKINDKEYMFESRTSLLSFVSNKLYINTALYGLISDETLVVVVNEVLLKISDVYLIIDKNTENILGIKTSSADLIPWRKILEIVHGLFLPIGEREMYVTIFDGLHISINMSEDDTLDVINIIPQTYSSIVIRRGTLMEQVSLRGHDEKEVLQDLSHKLYSMIYPDEPILV